MNDSMKASKARTRTQAQRDRILAAARTCFVSHGFHAASMAMIAKAAKMSPGLIYRYFDNKHEIVLAIIEGQLQCSRSEIAGLPADADLVPLFRDMFGRWKSRESDLMNPVLFLDMTAEASRDPHIAEALSIADKLSGSDLTAWLKKAARSEADQLSDRDLEARVFILSCLLGGLAIRAIRDPDVNCAVLTAGLQLVIPRVLSSSRARDDEQGVQSTPPM